MDHHYKRYVCKIFDRIPSTVVNKSIITLCITNLNPMKGFIFVKLFKQFLCECHPSVMKVWMDT